MSADEDGRPCDIVNMKDIDDPKTLGILGRFIGGESTALFVNNMSELEQLLGSYLEKEKGVKAGAKTISDFYLSCRLLSSTYCCHICFHI